MSGHALPGSWTGTLDEFAEIANTLLPQYLPLDRSSRAGDEVNPRLIRHYTTQGLLDPPLKEGREARYVLRHLLQLLALRTLMAGGYSAQALHELLPGKTDAELLSLLDGGARLEVHPDASPRERQILGVIGPPSSEDASEPPPPSPPVLSNPALAYLEGLTPSAAVVPSAVRPLSSGGSNTYTRLPILPGIELHVSRSARLPRSVAEQTKLAQLVQDALDTIQRRKP